MSIIICFMILACCRKLLQSTGKRGEMRENCGPLAIEIFAST